MYLFLLERLREKQTEVFQSTGSFPQVLQQLELGLLQAKGQELNLLVSHIAGR